MYTVVDAAILYVKAHRHTNSEHFFLIQKKEDKLKNMVVKSFVVKNVGNCYVLVKHKGVGCVWDFFCSY